MTIYVGLTNISTTHQPSFPGLDFHQQQNTIKVFRSCGNTNRTAFNCFVLTRSSEGDVTFCWCCTSSRRLGAYDHIYTSPCLLSVWSVRITCICSRIPVLTSKASHIPHQVNIPVITLPSGACTCLGVAMVSPTIRPNNMSFLLLVSAHTLEIVDLEFAGTA